MSVSQTMRRYGLWSGIAALWIMFLVVAATLIRTGNFAMADFLVYYQTGVKLAQNLPIYEVQVESNPVYLYPPLLAQALMIPAASLSYGSAWLLWFIFNALLLLVIVAALSRYLPVPLWLWVITPLFVPILQALTIGQVTIILLGLLAWAWIAVKREQHYLAGGLLALAAWIKVFPVLLIVYFIWKREWRVTLGAVVGGIALGILQIAISGSELMLEMFPTLFSLTNEGQSLWVYTNASILGFSTQAFLAHADTIPLVISPALYTISRLGLSLLVVGGMLYLTAPRRSKGSFDSEYSLVLLTSLLISPTLFPTSMPPVLLCYCLLIRVQPTKCMLGFCTLACFGLSLYGIINLLYVAEQPVSAMFAPLGFYILIITWGVNIYLLRKPSAHQPEPVFA